MTQKLMKNRQTLLLALVAAGAVLMLAARFLVPGAEGEPAPVAYVTAAPQEATDAREAEKRLEEFFALVEGAGTVRVMVGFSSVRETVFAVDSTANESVMREEDAQGGTRETTQSNRSQTTVLVPGSGGSRPLVVHERVPAINGIVIIAQGGADPTVRTALTRAAQAVLGLDAHRIQVLAKRSN